MCVCARMCVCMRVCVCVCVHVCVHVRVHVHVRVCVVGLECEIDIHKTVEEARTCRSGMVQTEEQYKFIYDVIKYYIETQKARIVAQVCQSPYLQLFTCAC